MTSNNPLVVRIDLDGIAVACSIQEFIQGIELPVLLEMNTNVKDSTFTSVKGSYDIYVTNIDGNVVMAADLPQIHLGIIQTSIGNLTVYVGTRDLNMKDTFRQLVPQYIREFLRMSNSLPNSGHSIILKDTGTEVTIKGILSPRERHLLLGYLEGRLPNLVIFMETFGNKEMATVFFNEWELLDRDLSKVFGEVLRSHLKVDLCLSVSYGEGTVTLATSALFEYIQLRPNYSSFFCNSACKLNTSLVSRKTGKRTLVGRNLMADKINFYSSTRVLFHLLRGKIASTTWSDSILSTRLHSLK